jgi:uncharacterized protein
MSSLVASIHDVSPVNLERCGALREIIAGATEGPVSLLVVPRLHGYGEWEGSSLRWLRDCAADGDEIVLHGQTHLGPDETDEREFARLKEVGAHRRILAGLAELGSVGLSPRGFVAPCYDHPPAVSAACHRAGLTWWATRNVLHWRGGRTPLFSFGFGTSTPIKRRMSPSVADGVALVLAHAPLLRLDLHPPDLADAGLRIRIDRVLDRLLSQGRALVTHEAIVFDRQPAAAVR